MCNHVVLPQVPAAVAELTHLLWRALALMLQLAVPRSQFQFRQGGDISAPPHTAMDAQGQGEAKPADGDEAAQGGARRHLHEMLADVSLHRQKIVQLRGMLDELQRKQTEAIADMFKTVVFRLNGVKRVDSPGKP